MALSAMADVVAWNFSLHGVNTNGKGIFCAWLGGDGATAYRENKPMASKHEVSCRDWGRTTRWTPPYSGWEMKPPYSVRCVISRSAAVAESPELPSATVSPPKYQRPRLRSSPRPRIGRWYPVLRKYHTIRLGQYRVQVVCDRGSLGPFERRQLVATQDTAQRGLMCGSTQARQARARAELPKGAVPTNTTLEHVHLAVVPRADQPMGEVGSMC